MHTECPNCTHSLDAVDRFCRHCGQASRGHRLGIRDMVVELLGGLFNFDGKNWLTMRTMLLQPGALTRHFTEGKVARYAPPIKVYLFTSFIFFILINLDGKEKVNDSEVKEELNTDFALDLGDDLKVGSDQVTGMDPNNFVAIDSLIRAHGSQPGFIYRLAVQQFIRFQGDKGVPLYESAFIGNMSMAMFVLFPLVALIVWLVTRRSGPWYMDCLIFSIHLQTVAFIVIGAAIALSLIGLEVPWWGTASVLSVYVLVALRSAFGAGWGRSLWRTILFIPLYLLSLAVLMGLTAVFSLFTF
jgi:hypothetical protein